MTTIGVPDTIRGALYGGPLDRLDYRPVFAEFFRQAQTTPTVPAIVQGDRVVSYGQLAGHALAIAAALRETGLRNPDRVGVCVERSIEATAALLGVLAAGLVYVPVDIRNPPERVAHMVATSAIGTVLTGATVDTFNDLPQITVIPVAAAMAGGVPVGNVVPLNELPVTVEPDTDAYVIYTSGTTGVPKGVVGRHRQFTRQMDGWRQLGYTTPGFRGAVIASYGFDSSFLEHFLPLSSGGTIVVFEQHDICDTDTLGERLCDNAIEFAVLSPALLDGVASYFERTGRRMPLRWLISGGEPVPNDALGRFLALEPGLDIRVGYGTTEATIAVTTHPFDPADSSRFSPIGQPMPGYHVFLLDDALEPVDRGQIGQMYVSGDVLTNGYDSNPDETRKRFQPNPFADSIGKDSHPVMYKTGDLARIDPTGALRHEGRVDSQVQVRGLRVELGEVEAAVARSFGTRVYCGVHQPDDGAMSIAAFVVDHDVAAVPAAVERLYRELPAHMMPSYLVLVDELPVTINDKVDRGRLPTVTDNHLLARYRRTAPLAASAALTATESTIIDSAHRILRIDIPIGADDLFIELGAHSLQIVKLVVDVQRTFAVKVPVKQMDAAQLSTRSLAEVVDRERASCGKR